MAGDLTRTKVSNYDVTWGSYSMGYVDKVDPTGMKLVTKVIKVGTLGDIPLGERVIGLEGVLKMEIREVDNGTVKAMTAWGPSAGNATPGTSSASIALVPATFHADLYDFAQALVLHPTHLPSNQTQEDLTLVKAVPRITYMGERDGVKDNVMHVEFSFFPDRSALTGSPPIVSYGHVGP